MKKPLNEEPGVTEHDGIDCCWSVIYGLGCDKGRTTKRQAKMLAEFSKKLLSVLE